MWDIGHFLSYEGLMSIWSKEELTEAIKCWKAAYLAVSAGKSYTIAGRSLTYQDVSVIRKQLSDLENELASLEGRPCGLKFFKAGMRR